MNFLASIRLHFSLLLRRRAFYISYLLFLFICLYYAFHAIKGAVGTDLFYQKPAFMHFCMNQFSQVYHIITGYAMILCGFAFSDSYFIDRSVHLDNVLLTKIKRSYYYVSKLLVTFFGAILIFGIPLLLNQFVLLSFFPLENPVDYVPSGIGSVNYFNLIYSDAFSSLYFNHPYLHTVLFAFLFSFNAGLFACMAQCLCYTVKKYKIIALAMPFMLYLISILLDILLIPIFNPGYMQGDAPLTIFIALYNFITPTLTAAGMGKCAFLLYGSLLIFVVVSTARQIKKDQI